MKRDELLTKAAMEIERWPDEHTPISGPGITRYQIGRMAA